MTSTSSNILWNRLRYVLSPQFDIYEVLSNRVDGTVADIGCGTGFGTHLLMKNADSVHGFDVDEEAVSFARKVFPFDNIKFNLGNITEGIDGTYNCVTLIDVIEHIQDDVLAVKNVKKMLSEHGVFICSTPNRLSRYRKADTHYREYSPDEFREVLKSSFRSVEMRNYQLETLVSNYENPMVAICS